MTDQSPARLIDGKALAARIRVKLKQKIDTLVADGNAKPGLAVILVGADPASAVYVRNKIRACEEVGITSFHETCDADLPEAELLAKIAELNADPTVHGILVQLPLPKHIDPQKVIEAIDPSKDVDGFHPANVGLLAIGRPRFIPCTPFGVMKMLEDEQVPLRGATACVVGASNIVGKPMTLLLQAAGATVTICNSKTRDLAFHTKHADVLVVATGRPKMITGERIKPGAVVIDVGINRLDDGSLCGDVDFASASEVASAITPVPGGVGPMTIAMLLANCVGSAKSHAAVAKP
ncbi:MAG TPA: bifunctional methylenetetrahydrofolate dehydrogenase/methenyltetrahydrofolate cyclohydrolase FolD [Orrella sp.]